MKANELRIGNYVLGGKIVWIQQRAIVKGVLSGENYDLCYSTLQPIVLTEKWIVELCFEKEHHEDGIFWSFSQIYLDSDMVFCVTDSTGYNFIRIGNKIKYVHQLQNLYFALTSEELTTKK